MSGITTTVVPTTVTTVSDTREYDLVVVAPLIVTDASHDEIVTTVSAAEIQTTVAGTYASLVVVGSTVVTTLTAEQGPPGTDGADGAGQHTFPFSWGDATPASLMSASAGQMILAVTISLDVPFNGVGASLSLGDAGDTGRLLSSSMIDPTVVGAFENAPCLRFGSNTQILLTIVPGTGASSGSGVVSLCLE